MLSNSCYSARGCSSSNCGTSFGCGNICGCGTSCGCGSSCGCGNACGCNGTCGCGNACGCSGSCGIGSTCGCGGSCGCNSSCGCGNTCGCNTSCGCLGQAVPPLLSPGGLLVPRIVASGRACQQGLHVTLCISDLPDGIEPPLTLLSASPCGANDWEFISESPCQVVVRVTIPLVVQIRDCKGCIHFGHTSVTVDVPMSLPGWRQDLRRTHVMVLPSVTLCCGQICSENECFECRMNLLLDVYAARWEPSGDGLTVPCRPDLPIYPRPWCR